MTEQTEALQKLAALKAGYVSIPRPDITVAFDLAEAALIKAIKGQDEMSPRNLTKLMLQAVMAGGFMIMHRDEMQDALLMTAQIKSIVVPQPAK